MESAPSARVMVVTSSSNCACANSRSPRSRRVLACSCRAASVLPFDYENTTPDAIVGVRGV